MLLLLLCEFSPGPLHHRPQPFKLLRLMLSKSVDLLWLTGKPVQQLQLLLQQHALSSRHCVNRCCCCCCCWSVIGCCCWLYRNIRHQTPAMLALLFHLLLLLRLVHLLLQLQL
jgi:hypothetical protein